MKIDSGKLDVRLQIQVATETITTAGEPTTTWDLYYATWAMRTQASSGKEEIESMQMVSSDMTDFTIRYPFHSPIPTTKMRVIETILGFEYDIENIRIIGRNEFLVLICKQRQQR